MQKLIFAPIISLFLFLLLSPLHAAFEDATYFQTEKQAVETFETNGYKVYEWGGVTKWVIYDPPYSPAERIWLIPSYKTDIWSATFRGCGSGRCIYHTDLIAKYCKIGETFDYETRRCNPLLCPQTQYANNGTCIPIPNCDNELLGSAWNTTSKKCECPENTTISEGICHGDSNSAKDGESGECSVPVGSYVIPKYREFHEDINLAGLDVTLHYANSRVIGYKNPLYPFLVSDIAEGWTLSNVAHYANKTLFLGNGKVVEYEDHEIITAPKTKNIIVFDESHVGYEFDKNGKILKTFDPKGEAVYFTFSYDKNGLLTSFKDIYGKTAKINYNSDKLPVSITSSYGQITYLDVDRDNNLFGVRYEDASDYGFTYNEKHLLSSKTTPNNNIYRYYYDSSGRISKTINPLNQKHIFNSQILNNVAYASFLTPSGSSYSYANAQEDANGVQISTSRNPFGEITQTITNDDAFYSKTESCAVTAETTYDIDAITQQKTVSSVKQTMPSGLEKYETYFSYYKNRPSDTYKKTLLITKNGKETQIVTDYYLGDISVTSPMGRKYDIKFDKKTLLAKSIGLPSLSPIVFTYNGKNELIISVFGTRIYYFTYDRRGNMITSKNAYGSYKYAYDNMDRVTAITDPNNNQIYFYYDIEGNMIRLKNPASNYNYFSYSALNQKESWTSPVGYKTNYIYNEDGNIASITKPSGATLTNIYDNSRVIKTITPETTYEYSYTCGNRLSKITSSDYESVDYRYDGELLTDISYHGTLNQNMGFSYNNDFMPKTFTYADETEEYIYDNDSFLIKTSNADLVRDKKSGFVEKVTDDNFAKTIDYNPFGEEDKINDTINKKIVFSKDVSALNLAGQVLSVTEKTEDKTIHYFYAYDKDGRLIKAVSKHFPRHYDYIEEFSYDDMGNIKTYKITNGSTTNIYRGNYNVEDNIDTFGDYAYKYNADGFLTNKISNTNSSDTAYYTYGMLGELREVRLPDKTITYLYNANNQISAKLINGEVIEKYLWRDLTTLLAVYDKNDNLMQRYYYANDRVPYKAKINGEIYYLSYNHQKSLRAVTDIYGNNIKTIDYNVYGKVLKDTNEEFKIPFGFAGGFYDMDTKLTRFGFRDYDAYSGRWTAKDPIDFNGGDINLYRYVLNDPVNRFDPYGLAWQDHIPGFPSEVVDATAGFGDTVSFGLTDKFRETYGGNGAVDKCSDAYNNGDKLGNAFGYILPTKKTYDGLKWVEKGVKWRKNSYTSRQTAKKYYTKGKSEIIGAGRNAFIDWVIDRGVGSMF